MKKDDDEFKSNKEENQQKKKEEHKEKGANLNQSQSSLVVGLGSYNEEESEESIKMKQYIRVQDLASEKTILNNVDHTNKIQFEDKSDNSLNKMSNRELFSNNQFKRFLLEEDDRKEHKIENQEIGNQWYCKQVKNDNLNFFLKMVNKISNISSDSNKIFVKTKTPPDVFQKTNDDSLVQKKKDNELLFSKSEDDFQIVKKLSFTKNEELETDSKFNLNFGVKDSNENFEDNKMKFLELIKSKEFQFRTENKEIPIDKENFHSQNINIEVNKNEGKTKKTEIGQIKVTSEKYKTKRKKKLKNFRGKYK